MASPFFASPPGRIRIRRCGGFAGFVHAPLCRASGGAAAGLWDFLFYRTKHTFEVSGNCYKIVKIFEKMDFWNEFH